jgi:pectin lyase
MPVSGKTYTLLNEGSGLVLDVAGADTRDGIDVIQWTSTGKTNQQWMLTDLGGGAWSIRPVHSNKSLDVYSWSNADKTPIKQWSYSGQDNQRWNLNTTANGGIKIVSVFSKLPIAVQDSNTNSKLMQLTDSSSAFQRWYFNPVDGVCSGIKTGPIGFGAGTTGGTGGAVVTVTTPGQLAAALCATSVNGSCTDTTPRVIRVSGILDFRGTEGTKTELGCTYSDNNCSVNGKSERILSYTNYCTGKSTYNITYDAAAKTPLLVGSNKTLIGVGAGSGIKGKGLYLKNGVSNITIRNLSITDLNDGIVWAGDAITIDNASKIWIDHNYFARIGRQMIVTGWGTAQNVTISDNYFDGTTEYAHWCNGKAYWIMLLAGDSQTITLSGNRIHNTSGRSPDVGKPPSGSAGIIHLVNNYYDGNYYSGGLIGSNDVATLVEGNYFAAGDYYFPIFPNNGTNKLFAPIGGNIAQANNTCIAVLGRNCMVNNDFNSRNTDFTLNPAAMSTIQASNPATQAIKSVTPMDPSILLNRTVGPQADITQ